MNHRSSFLLLASAAALALAGCASSGNRVLKDETQASVQQKIVEGTSTKDDVKADFGAPMSISFTDGGAEIWQYDFEKVRYDAISYIPIVGALARSATGTRKELAIMFDRNDVVQRVSLTEAAVQKRDGLLD